MPLYCPNCRERVSFMTAFRTPAWGSFACKACGSVLTISFVRRIMAAAVWVAIVIVAGEWLGFHQWGRFANYAIMGISLIALIYLFEKIIVIDRRAFTCMECGYDLQGLPEARCPECGTAFDPSELARIRARVGLPAKPPRNRWIAVIVVILLSVSVAAGFVAWQNSAVVRPVVAPTTSNTATGSQPAADNPAPQ